MVSKAPKVPEVSLHRVDDGVLVAECDQSTPKLEPPRRREQKLGIADLG